MTFEIRVLAAEETQALRRSVSADGRTDLPSMHHPLDDAPGSWHLGAVDLSNRVVATSSFYRVPCPLRPDLARAIQLQFMAVDPTVQRRGVGSALMAEAIRRLLLSDASLLWASARDDALPFYRRFGFTVAEEGRSTPAETGRPHHLILLDVEA